MHQQGSGRCRGGPQALGSCMLGPSEEDRMDLEGLKGWGEGAGAFGDVGEGWTWLDNFSSMILSPGPNPGLLLWKMVTGRENGSARVTMV